MCSEKVGLYSLIKSPKYVEHSAVPLTKTNLSKFVGWTSSRYNDYNKTQVVKWMFDVLSGTRITVEWKHDASGEVKVVDANGELVGDATLLGGEERINIKLHTETYSCGVYVNPAGSQVGGDYLVSLDGGFVSKGHFGLNWYDFVEEERQCFTAK
jgi:hypothetical protein